MRRPAFRIAGLAIAWVSAWLATLGWHFMRLDQIRAEPDSGAIQTARMAVDAAVVILVGVLYYWIRPRPATEGDLRSQVRYSLGILGRLLLMSALFQGMLYADQYVMGLVKIDLPID